MVLFSCWSCRPIPIAKSSFLGVRRQSLSLLLHTSDMVPTNKSFPHRMKLAEILDFCLCFSFVECACILYLVLYNEQVLFLANNFLVRSL
jgi:hypothetical protein